MEANRTKIRPNWTIVKVCCIYLIITKLGQTRAASLSKIEAKTYYKSWQLFCYKLGQLLQIGA